MVHSFNKHLLSATALALNMLCYLRKKSYYTPKTYNTVFR